MSEQPSWWSAARATLQSTLESDQVQEFLTTVKTGRDAVVEAIEVERQRLEAEAAAANAARKEAILTYVTPRVIAMAMPSATPQPGENAMSEVAEVLEAKHRGRYMVWNLSERTYDTAPFGHQVIEYSFPLSPIPPLGTCFEIAKSIEGWLLADGRNVAVVHCASGRGRTASLIACYLMWSELGSPGAATGQESVVLSLTRVSEAKALPIGALTIPSQRRYLDYFSRSLSGRRPRSHGVMLQRVIMHTVPCFEQRSPAGTEGRIEGGCRPYLELLQAGRHLIWSSVSSTSSSSTAASASASASESTDHRTAMRRVEAYWTDDACAKFDVGLRVEGDIVLRMRHLKRPDATVNMLTQLGARAGLNTAGAMTAIGVGPTGVGSSSENMLRVSFYVGYVPDFLRLGKVACDGACGDARFDPNFALELAFGPASPPTEEEGGDDDDDESDDGDDDAESSSSSDEDEGGSESTVSPAIVPRASGGGSRSSSSGAVAPTLPQRMPTSALAWEKDALLWREIARRREKGPPRPARTSVAHASAFSIDSPAAIKLAASSSARMGASAGAAGRAGATRSRSSLAPPLTSSSTTTPESSSSSSPVDSESAGSHSQNQLDALKAFERRMGLDPLTPIRKKSSTSTSLSDEARALQTPPATDAKQKQVVTFSVASSVSSTAVDAEAEAGTQMAVVSTNAAADTTDDGLDALEAELASLDGFLDDIDLDDLLVGAGDDDEGGDGGEIDIDDASFSLSQLDALAAEFEDDDDDE